MGRYSLRTLIRTEQIGCKVCGLVHSFGGLHIHHRDKNPKNNADNNLMVLCQRHHIELHKHLQAGREYHGWNPTVISFENPKRLVGTEFTRADMDELSERFEKMLQDPRILEVGGLPLPVKMDEPIKR